MPMGKGTIIHDSTGNTVGVKGSPDLRYCILRQLPETVHSLLI